MSTLMEIMPDKPRVSIDVNTNGDNARQATREVLMSTLMEIMPDKPRVSIDVNTNGDNADKPRVSI